MLHGENVFGSEDHCTVNQHRGQNQLPYVKTACVLCVKIPPPILITVLPVTILHFLGATSQDVNTRQKVIPDLACIKLFFLLQLGEYC